MMDNITILDLFLMLTNGNGGRHQANLDVLKSVYERTHSYYLALASGILILVGSIIGLFTVFLTQNGQPSWGLLTIIAPVALLVLLLWLAIVSSRLSRLGITYLDFIQIYNLLRRFF